MQSFISKPKQGGKLCRGRKAFDFTPETPGIMRASVNTPQAQNSDSAKDENNSNGFIIVKKNEGVYYVRYDIIFAKAGDIFFMPRKVPNNFSLETDKVIPFEASAGEFEKFYNENYRELINFSNLSESLQ